MNVDIIIPIYNAFEELQSCLKSIYMYTDLTNNRLILINDNSPDERIKPYLDVQMEDEQAEKVQRKNILVIHNETNKGFSNNVNLGISQSTDKDVIILNSDTIVTANWLEKMTECAYSDASIGTVTPLSNNATLCSVPNFCEENVLPEGMSVHQMAAIVEKCSMKKYPRITVANGFCMYIKRDVMKCIGLFDAETFGRGYGEENDFCNRAEQMGYIHVMCDDTYIFHSGTKSFISKEKEAYIREHDRILHERYPKQMKNNAIHCRDNPNAFVGSNIAYHLDIWNGRKNILYLLQSDFKEGAENNVGGTQLHVKHLVEKLRETMNVFVAARNKDYLQVTAYVKQTEHCFRFYIGEREEFPVFRNKELANIFSLILEGFSIDLVHIHHTSTTSLDIFYEAEKRGIPVVYTVHDFYCVCPTTKLLDKAGMVCIGRDNLECTECLKEKCGLYERNDFLKHWRGQYAKILAMCKLIVVPSENTKDVLEKYYSEQKGKICVVEHGMDEPQILDVSAEDLTSTKDFTWEIDKEITEGNCLMLSGIIHMQDGIDVRKKVILRLEDSTGKVAFMPTNYDKNLEVLNGTNRFYCYLPNGLLSGGDIAVEVFLAEKGKYYQNGEVKKVHRELNSQSDNHFKVAFIGGINEEKGARLVYEVIKKGPSDVEWYIMGGIGDENLYQLKKNNLTKIGFYYQEDLSTYLKYHKIDAICILSKWAETFSYTLSEAITNNIPVIVTDIGALGQRVRKNGWGACVCLDENKAVQEVIKVIDEWKGKDDNYQEVCRNVEKYNHPTLNDMSQLYYDMYLSYITVSSNIEYVDKEINEKLYCAYKMSSGSGQEEMKLMDKINELENRLKIIDNSLAFRFALKLTGIRLPFKKKMRKLLLKLSKG